MNWWWKTPRTSSRPISPDEQIVVDVLDTEHHNSRVDIPDAILVTLNATTLRRSLGLLAQLQRTGLPACVVLTFTDDLARRNGRLDITALSRAVGVPMVAEVVAGHRDGLVALRREDGAGRPGPPDGAAPHRSRRR